METDQKVHKADTLGLGTGNQPLLVRKYHNIIVSDVSLFHLHTGRTVIWKKCSSYIILSILEFHKWLNLKKATKINKTIEDSLAINKLNLRQTMSTEITKNENAESRNHFMHKIKYVQVTNYLSL